MDLAAFRGNRLETLKGDRAGQHSIRITRQWRLWPDLGPWPHAVRRERN